MNVSEKSLPIDEVNAGMVLARELRDAHGSVLLPAQSTLTDATIAALMRRGIDSVTIEYEEAVSEAELALQQAELALQRERRAKRLTHLFRLCGTDDANGSLHRLVSQYRLEQP